MDKPDIKVRRATADDAEKMIAFVQQLADEPNRFVPLAPGEFNLTVEEERKTIAEHNNADNSAFFVAEANGQIISVMNCTGGKRQANRHAVTLGISVHRDWRDRGVGHQMMQAALDWARSTGVVTRVELFVYANNARAIHLYEKFGFHVEGRRRRSFFQNGEYIDDLLMSICF